MARDFRIVRTLPKGEIQFDSGKYTFVPKEYTPSKFKSYKSLKTLYSKQKNSLF